MGGGGDLRAMHSGKRTQECPAWQIMTLPFCGTGAGKELVIVCISFDANIKSKVAVIIGMVSQHQTGKA